MLYSLFLSHFKLSSRKLIENTTSVNKGTSLETIESQRSEICCVWNPEVKTKREVKAVFEVMADVAGAIEGTPLMMEDVGDAPMVHVSKQIKVGIDGDGILIGSPNRIDDHAQSTTKETK